MKTPVISGTMYVQINKRNLLTKSARIPNRGVRYFYG